MGVPSIADAAKPYLDYLDKEMTIEGILSAFCVAVGAAAFDRVLGAKAGDASSLIKALQDFSYPYVLAAIVGMMTAALFFYLQRSALAWLYGQLSLAATREMQAATSQADATLFDGGTSFVDGLNIGDSWSLWNCYKFGLSFLAVTAAEALLALFFAIERISFPSVHWLIAGFPFVIAAIVDLSILYVMNRRDES